ncbi:hypothetical protein G6F63_013994 [Rhizopus arrhizus]|nr:hypothetical protein G6F63_013994 [Rhizopus arrhizus]
MRYPSNSLSIQIRSRQGNRCANPDKQCPRSLLGLALRFNQPGRGIGPGDSLNDPYYRVPDRLGDRGWPVRHHWRMSAGRASHHRKHRDQPQDDDRVRHGQQPAPLQGLEPAGTARSRR